MEDCLTSVKGGVCDISFAAYTYEAKRLGLNNVMRDMALDIPTREIALRVWTELQDKFPEMRAEEKGFKVIARLINLYSANSIHTIQKLVKVPADLKGMKIIATGDSTKLVQAAGGSPISLGSPDWYMSLERKLGDGIVSPYIVIDSRGCTELLPFHTHVELGRGLYSIIMNEDRWNSLPSDIQKIIADCGTWLETEYDAVSKNLYRETLDKVKTLGQTIYKPNPEELLQWRALGARITEDWMERMKKMNKPGKAAFEEAQRLAKEYGK
jgi:TRAP-type C4-dicarboxylate transport system substrate-binding protein